MMPHVRYLAALAALLLCFNVTAQQKFEPQVGQAGKDVIWVPTPDDVVDRMLTMAQVTPSDFVIDLGSGDGKIAILAARKFGARSLGAVHGGLRDPRLRGASISFALVDGDGVRRDYTGRVTGTRMEGSFRDEKGSEGRWTASKK